MEPPISPLLYSILLFVGMLIMLETGRRLGIRRDSDQSERGNLGTIESAVFALFGLLMAFTFSGAASRFNEKRMLVAEEANTIETAYLRLDLVPAEFQINPAPDLVAGGHRQSASNLSSFCRMDVAAGTERDDRHHHNPHDGTSSTSATNYLRSSFWTRAHLLGSGRL